MNSTASLLWALLFGSIGLGFFIYGKKQRAVIPFIAGVALLAFPYFVTNSYLMVAIGLGLIAVPCFISL
jgi:predicted membrane protein